MSGRRFWKSQNSPPSKNTRDSSGFHMELQVHSSPPQDPWFLSARWQFWQSTWGLRGPMPTFVWVIWLSKSPQGRGQWAMLAWHSSWCHNYVKILHLKIMTCTEQGNLLSQQWQFKLQSAAGETSAFRIQSSLAPAGLERMMMATVNFSDSCTHSRNKQYADLSYTW